MKTKPRTNGTRAKESSRKLFLAFALVLLFSMSFASASYFDTFTDTGHTDTISNYPVSLSFSGEGSYYYWGDQSDDVIRCTMSTPYDISTATCAGATANAFADSFYLGFAMSEDGNYFATFDSNDDLVVGSTASQYSVVSGGSAVIDTLTLPAGSYRTGTWKDDGTAIYTVDYPNCDVEAVYFDGATLTYTSETFNTAYEYCMNFDFMSGGTQGLLFEYDANLVHLINFSTPYNLSTGTDTGITFATGGDGQTAVLAVDHEAGKFYTAQYNINLKEYDTSVYSAVDYNCNSDLSNWVAHDTEPYSYCNINNSAFVLDYGTYNFTNKRIVLNGGSSFDGSGSTLSITNDLNMDEVNSSSFFWSEEIPSGAYEGDIEIFNFTSNVLNDANHHALITSNWYGTSGWCQYDLYIHDITHSGLQSILFDTQHTRNLYVYDVNATCTATSCFTIFYSTNYTEIKDSTISEIGYIYGDSDLNISNTISTNISFYGILARTDLDTNTFTFTNNTFSSSPTFSYGIYSLFYNNVVLENNYVDTNIYIRGEDENGSLLIEGNTIVYNPNDQYNNLHVRNFLSGEIFNNDFPTGIRLNAVSNMLVVGNEFDVYESVNEPQAFFVGNTGSHGTINHTTVTYDSLFFDDDVSGLSFGDSFASIDSGSSYNQEATISFYDVPNSSVVPHVAGIPCETCTNIINDGERLTFDVVGFSNYTYGVNYSLLPTGVEVYSPCNVTITLNSTKVYTLFNWSESTSPLNLTVDYNLWLSYLLEDFRIHGGLSTTYKNKSLFSSNPTAEYNTIIESCDSEERCYNSTSVCTFNLCTNDWEEHITSCTYNGTSDVWGIEQTYYTDANNCPLKYDIPLNNGTYNTCDLTDNGLNEDASTLIFVLYIISIVGFLLLGFLFPPLLILSGIITVFFSFYVKASLGEPTLFVIFLIFGALEMLAGILFTFLSAKV